MAYLSGSVVYLIFGTGELQEWNDPKVETVKTSTELQEKKPLKEDSSV